MIVLLLSEPISGLVPVATAWKEGNLSHVGIHSIIDNCQHSNHFLFFFFFLVLEFELRDSCLLGRCSTT
jgi:hypothetical protein